MAAGLERDACTGRRRMASAALSFLSSHRWIGCQFPGVRISGQKNSNKFSWLCIARESLLAIANNAPEAIFAKQQ